MKKFGIMLLWLLGVAQVGVGQTSPPTLQWIDSPAPIGSAQPFLARGSDGNVHMIWTQLGSNDATAPQPHRLIHAVHDGKGWSPSSVLAEGSDWFINWADFPVLAVRSDGSLLSHYLPKSGKGTFAYDVKLVASSQNRILQKILHDDQTQTEHGFVSMVPWREGFLVVWLDGRQTATNNTGTHHDHSGEHGAMTLRAALVSKTGEKQQEWLLDERVCDCCQTSAVATETGVWVAYRNRSDTEVRDIYLTFFDGKKWQQEKPLHQDHWQIHGCPVNGPKLATNGSIIAAAWFTGATDPASVNLAVSYDQGQTFVQPTQVSEAHALGRIGLQVSRRGTLYGSWMEQQQEGTFLMIVSFASDLRTRKWTVRLPISAERSTGVPQLILDQNEDLLVALNYADSNVNQKRIRVGKIVLNEEHR